MTMQTREQISLEVCGVSPRLREARMKNAKLLLLTVVLLLTLTGCRTRTTVPVDPIPDENGETAEDQLGQTDRAEEAENDPAAEEDVRPDADAPTATDPDSDRKTYAEDADAEIVPGADQALTQQGGRRAYRA